MVVETWTDPDGAENARYQVNGTAYSCSFEDSGWLLVSPTVYTDDVTVISSRNEGSKTIPVMDWTYQPVTVDVSKFKDTGGDGEIRFGMVDIAKAGCSPRPASSQTRMPIAAAAPRAT